MNLKSHIDLRVILPLVASLIVSCAQQVAPSGGPMDREKPEITASEPLNYSTGFTGNKIKIKFNEFVQLKNITEQLVVSPPLKEVPDIKLNGKWLTMTISDTLLPNTTYSFQFGDAIGDLAENNILDSNLFVISTGSQLDSLQLRVVVFNAETLVPEKSAWVLLHKAESDSAIQTIRPYYLGRTKEDGSCILKNLGAGEYRIYALSDMNSNYLFDLPEESVAWRQAKVAAGDSTAQTLYLFKEDHRKQFVKKSRVSYDRVEIALNLPHKSPVIHSTGISAKKSWTIEERSLKEDTMTFWFSQMEGIDSLHLVVADADSTIDTLDLAIVNYESDQQKMKRGGKQEPDTLILRLSALNGSKQNLYKPIRLSASSPILHYNKDSIALLENGASVTFELRLEEHSLRKFEIHYPWKEESIYTLRMGQTAFTDHRGKKSDSLSVSFKTGYHDEYGSISLNLSGHTDQSILFLLNEGGQILDSSRAAGNIQFSKLEPGKYRLKSLADDNGNGRWDTGNYSQKLQPEKVRFYSGPIDIRRGFESVVDWKIPD